MNIDRLNILRSDMENEIHIAIDKATNKFRKKTGITPSHISIDMMEVNTVGAERLQYIVNSVKADVET